MHHQGHVDVPEAAVLPHGDLGPPGLLSGGAVDHQLKGLVEAGVLQGNGGAADAGPLHLVAAAVAQLAQGVVLAQQPDPGAALPLFPGGAEGGGPAGQAALDLKAVFLQVVLQQAGGEMLLPIILGIVKDAVRHVQQPLGLIYDELIQCFLHDKTP